MLLDATEASGWSRAGLPTPLRKRLLRDDHSLNGSGGVDGGGSVLEAVHLHVLSETSAGAKRMLAVRDLLRRDAGMTEGYNALQLAGARGELAPDAFERERQAFFDAAAAGNDCGERSPVRGDCADDGDGGGCVDGISHVGVDLRCETGDTTNEEQAR